MQIASYFVVYTNYDANDQLTHSSMSRETAAREKAATNAEQSSGSRKHGCFIGGRVWAR